MMERVFIAEVHTPEHSDYDPSKVLVEMRNMRQVFENRLKDPSAYEARGVENMIGIVTAPGQFRGFSGYPKIGTEMDVNITTAMSIANGSPTAEQAVYAQFVQNAKTAASESITRPVAGYPYATAWVTEGALSPGANFFLLGTVGRNTFYGTLPPHSAQTSPHHHADPLQGKTTLEKLRHHAAEARANAAAKPVPEHMKLLMKLKALRAHQFPSFAPIPRHKPAPPRLAPHNSAPPAAPGSPAASQSLKNRIDDMMRNNPQLAKAVTAATEQRSAFQIAMAARAMIGPAIAASTAAGVSSRAGTAGALAATMARSTLPSFVPPPRRGPNHGPSHGRPFGSATPFIGPASRPSFQSNPGTSEN